MVAAASLQRDDWFGAGFAVLKGTRILSFTAIFHVGSKPFRTSNLGYHSGHSRVLIAANVAAAARWRRKRLCNDCIGRSSAICLIPPAESSFSARRLHSSRHSGWEAQSDAGSCFRLSSPQRRGQLLSPFLVSDEESCFRFSSL
jgi:hypothetical protein